MQTGNDSLSMDLNTLINNMMPEDMQFDSMETPERVARQSSEMSSTSLVKSNKRSKGSGRKDDIDADSVSELGSEFINKAMEATFGAANRVRVSLELEQQKMVIQQRKAAILEQISSSAKTVQEARGQKRKLSAMLHDDYLSEDAREEMLEEMRETESLIIRFKAAVKEGEQDLVIWNSQHVTDNCDI